MHDFRVFMQSIVNNYDQTFSDFSVSSALKNMWKDVVYCVQYIGILKDILFLLMVYGILMLKYVKMRVQDKHPRKQMW